MSVTRHAPAMLFAVLLAFGTDAAVQAQGMRGQQTPVQDRLHRMDQQLQRLDRLHDRIRQMDQDMMRDMDRLRDRLHAPDAQRLRDADRLRTEDRLRQHERLHAATTALGQMAGQMRDAMVHVRAMEGDPAFDRDPAMQRETERLREHFQKMCDDLEEGVRMMEQVQQRLRQNGTGP